MPSSTTDQILCSDVSVIGVIDLLKYDHNLAGLRQQLADLKKPIFASNEKIVVLHVDVEYFYHGHMLGFTTHNLFAVWRELDIPYSAMLLLHNHAGLERGIESFIVNDRDRPTTVNVLVNKYSVTHVAQWIKTLPSKNLTHVAACLLGLPRSHRVVLMQYLTYHGLLDRVKTNFGVSQNNYALASRVSDVTPVSLDSDTPLHTVYSSPHRSNESVFAQSREPEILEVLSTPVKSQLDPGLQGSFDDFYHNIFVDIVTETLFDTPHVFVSEKTLRPLIACTPFVLFGAQHSLQNLRDHGFQTFSTFWDESYDSEPDPHLRFLSACRTIKVIANWSVEQAQRLYDQMLPILEHNRQTLIDYIQNQHQPLHRALGLHDPH
jgi:hypothetical protein